MSLEAKRSQQQSSKEQQVTKEVPSQTPTVLLLVVVMNEFSPRRESSERIGENNSRSTQTLSFVFC